MYLGDFTSGDHKFVAIKIAFLVGNYSTWGCQSASTEKTPYNYHLTISLNFHWIVEICCMKIREDHVVDNSNVELKITVLQSPFDTSSIWKTHFNLQL